MLDIREVRTHFQSKVRRSHTLSENEENRDGAIRGSPGEPPKQNSPTKNLLWVCPKVGYV